MTRPDTPIAPPIEDDTTADGPVVATRSRHLVIRASAGSGKTYQLVIRLLRTLLDGVPAERILASTFTRKAAGEILERLLGRLAKASRDPDDLQQLAGHLGVPEFDREACLTLLKSLCGELHRLRIGTLDAFFARLAKTYTLELGLPPGWDMIETLDDDALRAQSIETVLRQNDQTDIHRLTNLISKGDAARSVSAKIHETVKEFYDIYQQTDEAAWHRFPDLHPLSSETRAETLVELGNVDLPDLKSYRKARDDDCERAAADEWMTFLSKGFPKKILSGSRTFGSSKKEISDEALALYQQLIGHARAIILKERAGRTAATYELLTKFDAAYRRLKREHRWLRFDDITLSLARALSDETVQQVMYRLDSDVSHLLLDEFQDTSPAQWDVLRPFAERISKAEEGTSFFCVGDAKQAIYGWRGGVAEIFDAVDEQLPGIVTAPLIESRRSSQIVIDAVNQLFQQMPRHENLQHDEAAIRGWCDAFEKHETALDIAGHVTVETPRESDGSEAETAREKVLPAAARRVAEIVAIAPEAEIAVLVRTNKSIAPVIFELRKRGIDASEEGGNPLTDSAGVLLLLSLMRLADHPCDTAARFHIASSPLGAVLDFTGHDDDAAAARLAAHVRRKLSDDGYGPTFERWVRSLSAHVSDRDRGRLGQLVELAYQYDAQATLRPTRFVQYVESTKVAAPSPAKVRVMSIHQAKGLQFDAVVLPVVEHSLIARTPKYVAAGPSPTAPPDLVFDYPNADIRPLLPETFQAAWAASRAATVREELCGLYVAVTRAAHALHVIVPACEKSGDKLPKNTAGLVRAGLCDAAAAPEGTVMYEHGGSAWTEPFKKGTTAAADVTFTEPAVALRLRFAEMADGRSRGLGRVAPSQAGGDERVSLSQLARAGDSIALRRGSLLHKWFEQIGWLEDGLLGDDDLLAMAAAMGFSREDAERLLAEFHQMVRQPAITELLSAASYAVGLEPTVLREQPVAVRQGSDLLQGTIDRLVLLRENGQVVSADIIDFKSDAVGPAGAAALPRMAHYRRQLEAYTAAVSRMYHLPSDRITARLAFVDPGEVVSV